MHTDNSVGKVWHIELSLSYFDNRLPIDQSIEQ